MGVGNGDVNEWRGVLRKVMLETGVVDGDDGRLLDRVSVLRGFLVLSLSIGVGVEYPEFEECVEC